MFNRMSDNCISYLCRCKLSLKLVVSARHNYYLMVSVEPGSGCGLAASSGPGSLALEVELGLFSSRDSTGKRFASSLTQEVAGTMQFLTG